MANALQIGDRTFNPEQLIPLLSSYQLMPQLLREGVIDRAIATVDCTTEETIAACQHFYQQHQLTSEAEQLAWRERYSMTIEDLEATATRKLRIQKFKQMTWGNKLESYFLKRKRQLDQAVYSIIRVKDPGLAHELYFRIEAGEQSFVELAQVYSQGPEAQTGGLVGPVELGTVHPQLGQILAASQPGQLWAPKSIGGWFVIVRLDRFVPTQLTDLVRQRLLNELFESWIQAQINELPESDKAWLQPASQKSIA